MNTQMKCWHLALIVSIWLSGHVFAETPGSSKPIGVVLLAEFEIKPQSRAAFLSLAKIAIVNTLKEPGCVSYSLSQNPWHPNKFTYSEEWVNRAALDMHLKASYTQDVLNKIAEIQLAPADVRIHQVVSTSRAL